MHLFSTRILGGLRVFSPEFARRKNGVESVALSSYGGIGAASGPSETNDPKADFRRAN